MDIKVETLKVLIFLGYLTNTWKWNELSLVKEISDCWNKFADFSLFPCLGVGLFEQFDSSENLIRSYDLS